MSPQEKFAKMLAAMTQDDLTVAVLDADVDALIDEVYGKPGLGVEDSGGLVDVDHDAEADDYAEYMMDAEWLRGGC